MLWVQGGPGCASTGQGALYELGPFRVRPDATLGPNAGAWNETAVLFLDQPVGTGFSPRPASGYQVHTAAQAAADMLQALVALLRPGGPLAAYGERRFFLAGESFAGRYIPELAHA